PESLEASFVATLVLKHVVSARPEPVGDMGRRPDSTNCRPIAYAPSIATGRRHQADGKLKRGTGTARLLVPDIIQPGEAQS
ncbi:MAG: hypothetical protein J2P54_22585, partial [Bradyrhizobiaceae bacterium]|nr:hypothetical protein [Bradyrhizobiaceae bacterium]